METMVTQAWSKGKPFVKGLMISFLILLLLIPSYYVRELISERESRQKEAIADVTGKWAGRQTLSGPILVLPYWEKQGDAANTPPVKRTACFLPEQLFVKTTIQPIEKYRGIYKVMLYDAQLDISGNIGSIPFEQLQIPETDIIWKEAYLRFQVSDLKGLNEEPVMKWKDTILSLAPGTVGDSGYAEGLTANLNVTSISELRNASFSAHLNISGAENLAFVPIGKSTSVQVKSKWPHPSFTGNILPQSSNINDSGFTASWKSLSHKRTFPQQFKGTGDRLTDLRSAAFGVDLFVPVNTYQKVMRSVKYAVLCILLTFAAFYLIETVNKRSVHPVQYALIGLALILFYTLLLSISEYLGFDIAYVIAMICTIGLISWFVKGVLASGKLSVLFGSVLMLMYGYVFSILQLQDYSLLLGGIGLFITLAVIMHFSRKLQW